MPCNADALSEIKLFSLLDEEDLNALAEVVDFAKVNENEILFHDGEAGESLFAVRSGEVELFIKASAGQKIVLAKTGKSLAQVKSVSKRYLFGF